MLNGQNLIQNKVSSQVKVSALARVALSAHFTAALVPNTLHGPLLCAFCPQTQCKQMLPKYAWLGLETIAAFLLQIQSFLLLQTHGCLIIENNNLIPC